MVVFSMYPVGCFCVVLVWMSVLAFLSFTVFYFGRFVLFHFVCKFYFLSLCSLYSDSYHCFSLLICFLSTVYVSVYIQRSHPLVLCWFVLWSLPAGMPSLDLLVYSSFPLDSFYFFLNCFCFHLFCFFCFCFCNKDNTLDIMTISLQV